MLRAWPQVAAGGTAPGGGREADRQAQRRLGSETHVVWDKFARYFDVEPRLVPHARPLRPLGRGGGPRRRREHHRRRRGPGDHLHRRVRPRSRRSTTRCPDQGPRTAGTSRSTSTAASGGFIAPFARTRARWDFRLPQVKSINVSGHKYGLVYPGVGWVVFRDRADLPEDLIFNVNYLGGDEATFKLNFSKGASQIVAQYYNFLRLGKEGYRRIMTNLRSTATYLADRLAASGRFALLSDQGALPLVAFRLAEPHPYTVYDIAERLRERGWIVPAYHLPADAEEVSLLRVVVREHFSRDMADLLLDDLQRVLDRLDRGALPPNRGRDPARRKSISSVDASCQLVQSLSLPTPALRSDGSRLHG